MQILADENIPQSMIHALRKAGFNVVDSKRKGRSIQDSTLLAKNYLILTFDKDFLALMGKPELKVKVVLLRVHPQTKENVAAITEFLLKSNILTTLKKSVIISLNDEQSSPSLSAAKGRG